MYEGRNACYERRSQTSRHPAIPRHSGIRVRTRVPTEAPGSAGSGSIHPVRRRVAAGTTGRRVPCRLAASGKSNEEVFHDYKD